MLAGWDLSGINRFQTGPYSTVTGTTSIGSRRADYRGGSVSLPSDERSMHALLQYGGVRSRARYASRQQRSRHRRIPIAVPVGSLDSARNSPPLNASRFVSRRDMFNLLNHANFRAVNTDSSSRDFGSISAAGPGA